MEPIPSTDEDFHEIRLCRGAGGDFTVINDSLPNSGSKECEIWSRGASDPCPVTIRPAVLVAGRVVDLSLVSSLIVSLRRYWQRNAITFVPSQIRFSKVSLSFSTSSTIEMAQSSRREEKNHILDESSQTGAQEGIESENGFTGIPRGCSASKTCALAKDEQTSSTIL